MPTIVQQGAVSPPEEGGLFQDVSFWVSSRVPARAAIVSDIKANGGRIVVGEKHADICIVDHMKDNEMQPGEKPVYSYRYIEKSVRNGELDDLDEYEVKPQKKKGRPAAKKNGVGRGYTAFTEEDDLLLFKTLFQAGTGMGGNKIYQKLEAEYPERKHTYHSWRGRWVDKYAKVNPDPLHWLQEKGLYVNEDESKDESDDSSTAPPPTNHKRSEKAADTRKRTDNQVEYESDPALVPPPRLSLKAQLQKARKEMNRVFSDDENDAAPAPQRLPEQKKQSDKAINTRKRIEYTPVEGESEAAPAPSRPLTLKMQLQEKARKEMNRFSGDDESDIAPPRPSQPNKVANPVRRTAQAQTQAVFRDASARKEPRPMMMADSKEDELGFTDQDDAVLKRRADQIVQAKGVFEMFQIFEAIAQKYDHHKASDWARRWERKVLPEINRNNVIQQSQEKENPVAVAPESRAKAGVAVKKKPPAPVPKPRTTPTSSIPPSSPPVANPVIKAERRASGRQRATPPPPRPVPDLHAKSSSATPAHRKSALSSKPQQKLPHSKPDLSRWRSERTSNSSTGSVVVRAPTPAPQRPQPPATTQKRKRESSPPAPPAKRVSLAAAAPQAGFHTIWHGPNRDRTGEVASTPEPESRASSNRTASPELGSRAPATPRAVRPTKRQKPEPAAKVAARRDDDDDDDGSQTSLYAPLPSDTEPEPESSRVASQTALPSSSQRQQQPAKAADIDDEITADLSLAFLPVASSPPRPPPTATSASDAAIAEDPDAFEVYVTWLARYCGVPIATAIDAMERTSAVTEPAQLICEALARGEPMPIHPAIWTKEEDKLLVGGDSKAISHLDKTKLGGCDRRMQFLQDMEYGR